MIADFDRRFAAASSLADGKSPSIVAMQVNSLASGPGSMLDEVFSAAGYHNMTRDAEAAGKLGPAGRLPLETLLLDPPDLIVLANAPGDFRTVLGDNLRHPAFEKWLRNHPNVHLPMSSWLCGTPAIAEAVERLAAVRGSLLKPPAERAMKSNSAMWTLAALAVCGVRGLGARWTAGHRASSRLRRGAADRHGDPAAARDTRVSHRRRAGIIRCGAARLPAQSAGRAGHHRRLRRRGAGRGRRPYIPAQRRRSRSRCPSADCSVRACRR